MDSFNFFSEPGPKSRLSNVVKNLEPSFKKVLEAKMPRLVELYQKQMLKVKNLAEVRREPTLLSSAIGMFNTDDVCEEGQKKPKSASPTAMQRQWLVIDK